ncbi:2-methylisocitrate lyase [Amycolatopsis deserti]|uniref:2-methylisocitrate lyase n=1 Tax=Amycolatopsis deserti TaxID=185696 RepID=A0ABQ3IVK1_9PSEU|nr:isocitrate lyase/phosphoenolpyruvate mutase family protein [Amycolatopsis deserti]GHE92690.1 2-methylisocitrate lyase [Amycolatopsis deserti]
MTSELNERAVLLRSRHDDLLVLPNAWDAASAAALAHAGAAAIGTTSAGIAWSLGLADGHVIDRDTMVAVVARIAAAVDVPVSADIENGYGEAPEEVAATVTAVIGAGAAGINLEDSRSASAPLHTPREQAERIRAARSAAVRAGVPDLVINARTDVFFTGGDAPADERLAEVIERGKVYAEAGADCLFVPGLLDLTALKALVPAVPLPVNVMAGPGAPAIAELAAVGVRRVSLGAALHLATYAATYAAAAELFESGTYTAFPDASQVAGAIVRR